MKQLLELLTASCLFVVIDNVQLVFGSFFPWDDDITVVMHGAFASDMLLLCELGYMTVSLWQSLDGFEQWDDCRMVSLVLG